MMILSEESSLRSLRIISPNGHLGFAPTREESFRIGVAARPDCIAADSGSDDVGPIPLGSDTSTFKDLTSRFIGIAQAYAVAVRPDEIVKDCLAAYAFMHFEIAAYLSLGAAALALEEPEIARMCNEHLERERAMASWLEQQIPEVTLEFLRP